MTALHHSTQFILSACRAVEGLSPARDERRRAERRDPPLQPGGVARAIGQPDRPAGVLHHEAGDPDIAGDRLHLPGEGAMLPAVAIAARRAAPLAAMHPAARAAMDRRRAARRPGPGARSAARRAGQDFRLEGGVRRHLHCDRSGASEPTDAQPVRLAERARKRKNKIGTCLLSSSLAAQGRGTIGAANGGGAARQRLRSRPFEASHLMYIHYPAPLAGRRQRFSQTGLAHPRPPS